MQTSERVSRARGWVYKTLGTLTEAAGSLLLLLVCSLPAQATQLTFDQVRFDGVVYPAGNSGVVPQDYGDRVAGVSQAVSGGTFTYGNLGEGFTPNVVVTYSPAGLWQDSYGDLSHVIWGSTLTPLQITLSADAGFLVQLHSFDLAGWPGADYTIKSISVLDGASKEIFRQNNAYVQGDWNGPRHSHFDFAPLQGSKLTLNIDITNLESYYRNVGLDNLVFSQIAEALASPQAQSASAVPEPGSALLFGLALLLTARYLKTKN